MFACLPRLTYSCWPCNCHLPASLAVSFFLLLLITVGNLALGFGLAVHLGFGPDFSRLAMQWQDWKTARGRRADRAASDANH